MSGRERLLAAAGDLFASQGFEGTTTREIAERAGVDATLIARYFGNKAGLYLAVLQADAGDAPPAALLDPDRMAALLGRVPGPVFQSAVRGHDDPELQAASRQALHARLVEPLKAAYDGQPRAQLRAELAVAAFAGIALGRRSGALGELAAADVDELVQLVGELLTSSRAPGTAAAGRPARGRTSRAARP